MEQRCDNQSQERPKATTQRAMSLMPAIVLLAVLFVPLLVYDFLSGENSDVCPVQAPGDIAVKERAGNNGQDSARAGGKPQSMYASSGTGRRSGPMIGSGLADDQSEWIRDRITHPDPAERLAAVRESLSLPKQQALGILFDVMQRERGGQVYEEAAGQVEALAGDAALIAMTTGLEHADPMVRHQAIEVLGEFTAHALPLLGRTLLGDPEPELRLLALRLLAAESSPAAIALLENAAEDPDPRIRDAARHARRGWMDVHGRSLGAREGDEPFFGGATGLREYADDRLFGLTRRSDPEDKIAAIHYIQALDGRLALEALQCALGAETDARVREETLFALYEIGGDAAVSSIATALGDKSNELRRSAISLIWNAESRNSLPLLGQVLQTEPDPALRLQAVEFLAAHDGPAARSLLHLALEDTDERVQLTAAEGLDR